MTNTSPTTFENKVKILSELVGMVPKTDEVAEFIKKNDTGCYLAFFVNYEYVSDINKSGIFAIEGAWENLLLSAFGENVWDEKIDTGFKSLSDLGIP